MLNRVVNCAPTWGCHLPPVQVALHAGQRAMAANVLTVQGNSVVITAALCRGTAEILLELPAITP